MKRIIKNFFDNLYKIKKKPVLIIRYFILLLNTLSYDILYRFHPLKRKIQSDKKISIIIPTLSKGIQADHLLKLKKLLSKYLPNQIYNNYEAIVYCDGPNQKVKDMVNLLNDDRIKVYETDKTLGKWGHPLTKLGIQMAKGDFFVRMNDDNKPNKIYLNTLLSGFKENIGITYSRVIFKGKARKKYLRIFVHIDWKKNNTYSFLLPKDKKGSLTIGNIDCMNYMIRMNLAKKYYKLWGNNFIADYIFIEKLLKKGIKAEFIDKVIGDKL